MRSTTKSSINAPVSWWVECPTRDGFTARAEQEAMRMRSNPTLAIATLGEAHAFKVKRKALQRSYEDEVAA